MSTQHGEKRGIGGGIHGMRGDIMLGHIQELAALIKISPFLC
jgi:hypothetical protein